MESKFNIYTVAYIVACFASLFFIDTNSSLAEMNLKITSLVVLAFMYIGISKKIDFWYIFILMTSIAADSFFVYDPDFLMQGVVLVLINRILYFIFLRKKIAKIKLSSLLIYLIPGFVIFGVILYMFSPHLKNMLNILFVICFCNISLISIAYFNFLKNNNKKNLFFLLGVFMISAGDFFIVYNKYLEYNLFFVLGYTTIYYVARYLICFSVIEDRN